MSVVVVVLGCLLVWFAMTSRGFRRFVVLTLVLLAIAAGIWLLPEELPEKQAIKFVAPVPVSYADFMEIPAGNLAITAVSVQQPDSRESGYRISGKISNNSTSATLSSIKMKITVSKCRANCITVGERTVRIKVEVPPGQTKDFARELTQLRGLPARDNLAWNWDVVASYAKD